MKAGGSIKEHTRAKVDTHADSAVLQRRLAKKAMLEQRHDARGQVVRQHVLGLACRLGLRGERGGVGLLVRDGAPTACAIAARRP